MYVPLGTFGTTATIWIAPICFLILNIVDLVISS